MSDSEHVCAEYRRHLHLAISECSKEIRSVSNRAATALAAGLHNEIDKLEINGKSVKREDINWATAVLMDSRQMPHVVQRLFEKTDSEIKKTIEEVEGFLQKIQKRIKGIKIPVRPRAVDEWMKKTE